MEVSSYILDSRWIRIEKRSRTDNIAKLRALQSDRYRHSVMWQLTASFMIRHSWDALLSAGHAISINSLRSPHLRTSICFIWSKSIWNFSHLICYMHIFHLFRFAPHSRMSVCPRSAMRWIGTFISFFFCVRSVRFNYLVHHVNKQFRCWRFLIVAT